MKQSNLKYYLPLLLMVFTAAGIFVGSQMKLGEGVGTIFSPRYTDKDKLNDVINYISRDYVDEVKPSEITDKSIEGLLKSLDPHSVYIPPQDLGEVEESMMGNFFGIGVQFRQWQDSVVVINVIDGGPSQKAGIQAGDRLIFADSFSLVGLPNDSILHLLKGPRGTMVNVGVFRRDNQKNLNFPIVRDAIPYESLVASYRVNDSTAYVKIDRFAATTTKEVRRAIMKLGYDQINTIIVDLQNNGGGLLTTAISLTDEFLPKGKVIVYTEGRSRPRETSYSTAQAMFEDKNVYVLVNEQSASASEIFAGAIQDNDRGYIIGRRTFGKGLVQEQTTLSDHSAIRLTVARYYTATGRCIQKPYKHGENSNYYHELNNRYLNGEMVNSDSIHTVDSLKYTTPQGRIVYGGGGIMPDVYVPLDTSKNFWFYNMLQVNEVLYDFGFNYFDQHRKELLKKYPTDDDFIEHFKVDSKMMAELHRLSKEKNISWPEDIPDESVDEIKVSIKARLASDLYGSSSLYKVFNQSNDVYRKALEMLKGKSLEG